MAGLSLPVLVAIDAMECTVLYTVCLSQICLDAEEVLTNGYVFRDVQEEILSILRQD